MRSFLAWVLSVLVILWVAGIMGLVKSTTMSVL